MILLPQIAARQSTFPNFIHLVQYELPMLEFFQPRVYDCFVKYCTSQKWADQALQYGLPPFIQVVDTCESIREKKVAGFTVNRFPDVLFYDEDCVLKYEANPVVLRREMESLVLHEMIHWARTMANAAAKTTPAHADGEAGNEFEMECYGMDMSSRWNLETTCS